MCRGSRGREKRAVLGVVLCSGCCLFHVWHGINVPPQLNPFFASSLANCIPGTDCKGGKLLQYRSRRIVVSTLNRQMAHLIDRQEGRFSRHTRVVEETFRLHTCMRNMPGENLDWLNRGTWCQPSAFRPQQDSARSFSLTIGGWLGVEWAWYTRSKRKCNKLMRSALIWGNEICLGVCANANRSVRKNWLIPAAFHNSGVNAWVTLRRVTI